MPHRGGFRQDHYAFFRKPLQRVASVLLFLPEVFSTGLAPWMRRKWYEKVLKMDLESRPIAFGEAQSPAVAVQG
jgi:hypothetical protein